MKRLLTYLCLFLGLCAFYSIRGAEPDNRRQASLERLVARADSGDAHACFRLSYILEQGTEGFAPDTVRALRLLRTAADSSYAPAMNYLGYAYAVPLLGLTQNSDSALMWIERAAMAPEPDPKAFNNLGMLLLTGQYGVKRDFGKARYWLERGSVLGVPTATASLAGMYLRGQDVQPDTVQAIHLLRKAASQGLIDAGMQLADLLKSHTDTLAPRQVLDFALPYYRERIWPVAIPLIERAAEARVPFALAILGHCAAEGIAMPYDYPKAVRLYAEAAALGEPHAQYIVAEMLQEFPDLLRTLAEEGSASGNTVFENIPELDPDVLYGEAAAQGVTSAEEAIMPLRP